MDNLHVVETDKPIDEACEALHEACAEHRFGVLHVHDVKETMRKKGVEFDRPVRIFDVCNPHKAKIVLEENPHVSAVLPCAISLFTEGDKTRISFVRPTMMLSLFGAESLAPVADEVEATMKSIVAMASK
jgi:uncharacterized protein (DUF302 family)